MANPATTYIHALTGEPRGWRYGSDLAIYTERFIDGRLLAAAYQDHGAPIYVQHELRDRPAFDLVVDGESLTFGWELTGFKAAPGPQGVESGTLSLRHARQPLEL
jgi:alpha-galactosidase